MRDTTKGFTLIELMIVLAMIVILASVVAIGMLVSVVAPWFTGRSGDTSGEVVVDQPRSDAPSCVNGLVQKNGEPMVVNGSAVKC